VILKAGKQRFLLRELPEWWPEVLADADTQKIMHNAKFDLMWMIEFCPDEEQGQPIARNIQDTMLKSQLASRYKTRSGAQKAGRPDAWVPNDLKTCLSRYLDVSIDKSVNHDETDWTGPWSSDMIEYMLEDIDYLGPLNDTLDTELRGQGQERPAQIEQEVVFGTAWMTLNGLMPDVSLWEQAITEWRADHGHLLWHLQKMWPGVDNFNSTQQIQRASTGVLGGALKTTRKAVLKQLSGEHREVQALLEQRHLATRLKNWGPTFLRLFVCPMCHRFHPSWNQIGAETSRFSCSRPNAQQFPRAAEFRRMIQARPGHVLAALDYSAIEVVTAAVVSQDRKLLEACRTGTPT
jgi:DNA polymerase I-like protein with 3'-5' exonuclease and polymerase domains